MLWIVFQAFRSNSTKIRDRQVWDIHQCGSWFLIPSYAGVPWWCWGSVLSLQGVSVKRSGKLRQIVRWLMWKWEGRKKANVGVWIMSHSENVTVRKSWPWNCQQLRGTPAAVIMAPLERKPGFEEATIHTFWKRCVGAFLQTSVCNWTITNGSDLLSQSIHITLN